MEWTRAPAALDGEMSAAAKMCQRRLESALHGPVVAMLGKETQLETDASVILSAALTANMTVARSVIELYLPDDKTARDGAITDLHAEMIIAICAMFKDIREAF